MSRGRPPITQGSRHTERVFVYLPDETKRFVESLGLHLQPGPVTSAQVVRSALRTMFDHVERTGELPPAKGDAPCDAKLVALVTPEIKTILAVLTKHFDVTESELVLRAIQAEVKRLAPAILKAADEADAAERTRTPTQNKRDRASYKRRIARAAKLDPSHT